MIYVAVCGPADANEQETAWAEEVGTLLARAGAVVVCGGLGGVMDAAARGARSEGGAVIGILPGDSRAGASEHLTASIPTGMGEARNALIARSADAVIAISGEYGTLSEIALALKIGKPVVGLATWEISKAGTPSDAIVAAGDSAEAVRLALELGA
ncbi:MAG: TIGR00725 family protein [Actinomycetota bacterium]